MRTMTLLLCLALAGCLANTPHDVVGPAPAAAPAAAASPPSRAAHASAKNNEDWWKEGGVTREKINAMCWMKYEKGRKDIPVEKRADLVGECVAATLKEHPVR